MADEGRSSTVGSAWPFRISCYDGTVWDEMPDDLDHAFALVEEYDSNCGCERPGEHYVERSVPAVWERVTADHASCQSPSVTTPQGASTAASGRYRSLPVLDIPTP